MVYEDIRRVKRAPSQTRQFRLRPARKLRIWAHAGTPRSTIEAGARGGAIAVLSLLAALIWWNGRRVRGGRIAALFVLGLAATLVSYAQVVATDRAAWLAPFRVLAFGNPAVFWALASIFFDEEPRPSWRPAAAWLALVALGFWAVFGAARSRPFMPMNLLALICLALGLWPTVSGRADDLVEARRRLRLAIVGGVGLAVGVVILSSTALRGGADYPVFGLVNAIGALLLSLAFAGALLSFATSALFDLQGGGRRGPPPGHDLRDGALLSAQRREMEENRAYREAALSIAALAGRLGTTERPLRQLINQRLGHRNFSAFVNGYRLDEAMAWLADPSQDDTAILTVALDAGFQSVGPFNRAFKARTGLTPSEFRRRRLAESGNG
jgi:AraC-like DNA-binding protein